jgi:hypothetical protein
MITPLSPANAGSPNEFKGSNALNTSQKKVPSNTLNLPAGASP